MKIKFPKQFYSLILTSFSLLATSGSISAQAQLKTNDQNRAERVEPKPIQQAVTHTAQNIFSNSETNYEVSGFSNMGTVSDEIFSSLKNDSPISNGTAYIGNGNENGISCEQVFFDENQTEAVGFSNGEYKAANDIIIAAGESFTLQTMTFEMVTLGGEPSEFDLEIFMDNGSGGVGTSTGITHHFDSANMTFVENGTFTFFPQYSITLTLPNIELTANASEDARYWLAVASSASTTGKYTYWISYDYTTNPDSYSIWQYSIYDGWYQYVSSSNGIKEGIMTVSGICETGGGPGNYCQPELDCIDGSVITNVSFQEIDNTTQCGPLGYNDYTNLVATVQAGGTYPISVNIGDRAPNNSVSVWIDFDDSGTFDENEFFYIGTGNNETLSGNINIPAELVNGEYRMRVRVAAVDSGSATWDMACDESQTYGETEDYTVGVDGVVGIDDHSSPLFSLYPNPTSGMVNLSYRTDISTIAVYNHIGQQVMHVPPFNAEHLDLSYLPTGIYLFHVVFQDGSTGTHKVLKQ